MSIGTIEALKNSIKGIEDSLKAIDSDLFPSQMFGSESEYSYKDLIVEIKSIIVDVKTLVKSPEYFIKNSTYTDRYTINTHLSNVNSYLSSPPSLYQQVDALKPILISIGVRNSNSRIVELETEIGNVQKNLLEIESTLKSIQKTQKAADAVFQTIKTHEVESEAAVKKFSENTMVISEKISGLDSDLEALEALGEKIIELSNSSNQSNVEIQNLLTDAKTNQKIIEGFSKKVTDLETRLDSFAVKNETNENQLVAFEIERQRFLNEAIELITSAKKALNYKTAEGISAAIQEQYDIESKKWGLWWLVGAVLCLLTTIGLGVWILVDHSAAIEIIIGRVTLLPFPIIGAVFCANQYLKRQNLIQDYAYKMVLSKSLVGFSEQLLKSTDEKRGYDYFITNVLDEILQDPLRKRGASKKEKENPSKEPDTGTIVEAAKLFSAAAEKLKKLIPGE